MTMCLSSMPEEWRPVPSVPGLEASDKGRLRVPRFFSATANRWYGSSGCSGQWDGSRFTYRRRGKTYKVHRLVCEAFHGAAPFDRAVVMHLDENSANNCASNLAWGTQKENLNAPGFLAYCRTRVGDASPVRKGRTRATEGHTA